LAATLKQPKMTTNHSLKRALELLRNIALVLLIGIFFNNCKNKKNEPLAESRNEQEILDSTKFIRLENKHDTIIYISDFENYQRIEDVINFKEFKGKVLYFDIWSTFCGPCIKEFQLSKDLKERYKAQPVIFIYLVDTRNTVESLARWDSLINKYELYGYHMRMSNKFYNNITSIQGIRFVSKPHYIIVDKEGNIVYPNAERPSSKEKLYSQIDKLL
jgi:thiol-disulfide isomerase/thioredoxin